MGDADDEGGYPHVRAMGRWESLYLPLNFAVTLKLFKIKVRLKKAHTNREKIFAKDI